MKGYLLAHDLGTSGNKAVLYDLDGVIKESAVCSYDALYPRDAWVEQRADDWWRAICESTRLLIEKAGIKSSEILGLSFSGQMMGCLLVDKRGEPLRNSMIWADTRSAPQERQMLEAIGAERGYRLTGLRLSASYSAAKLLWVKDNEPELYGKACKMLQAKDYAAYKLTGNFVSDYSDASTTNLMDIKKKTWAGELIAELGIRAELLPELHASTDVVGKVTAEAARETGLAEGTPVVLGGGDGPSATVGAGVVEEGKAYNVIGSSSWISFLSREPYFDPAMRTFNFVHLDPAFYTPTGTMQAAGYSYSWYRNTLCAEERRLAKERGESAYRMIDRGIEGTKPGAGGVLFLPYLLGERSPRWNHLARGAFIGMGISTTKAELARALLEGVGYNLKVILDVLDGQLPIERLTVIGGGAKGDVWLQILSDIWQKPLEVPRYLEEASSMGAAVCAGVGVGAFGDFSVMRRFHQTARRIQPNPANAKVYGKMYRAFNQAYEGLESVYTMLAE